MAKRLDMVRRLVMRPWSIKGGHEAYAAMVRKKICSDYEIYFWSGKIASLPDYNKTNS